VNEAVESKYRARCSKRMSREKVNLFSIETFNASEWYEGLRNTCPYIELITELTIDTIWGRNRAFMNSAI
jgi:hypothetical protein